jgi:hypothetical protein
MKVHISNYPDVKKKWYNLWGLIQRERKVSVRVDPWDSWSADDTLALVIIPVIKQFREQEELNDGFPHTDPDDGPPEFLSDGEWSQARWYWILDEMIWAFENISDDQVESFYSGVDDWQMQEMPGTAYLPDGPHYHSVPGPNHTRKFDQAGYEAHEQRVRHGTYLFGKYFKNLWI